MHRQPRASWPARESKNGPFAFDVTVKHEAPRRWRSLEIVIKIPLSSRRIINNPGSRPFADRLLALVQLQHRAVVGELGTRPIFQETREVLRAPAVGAIAVDVGRNNARNNCRIDRGVAGNARAQPTG